MIPAFLAMVFADSLANYDTLLKIRPQTYIWGHIFIIVCALYAILIYKPKLQKKDLFNSIIFLSTFESFSSNLFSFLLHFSSVS